MKNTRLLTGVKITTIIVFIFLFAFADRKGPTVIDHKIVFSPPKKIKIIVVKEGESLSVIAEKWYTSWQRLAELNDMKENPSFLRKGRTLIIPVPVEE